MLPKYLHLKPPAQQSSRQLLHPEFPHDFHCWLRYLGKRSWPTTLPPKRKVNKRAEPWKAVAISFIHWGVSYEIHNFWTSAGEQRDNIFWRDICVSMIWELLFQGLLCLFCLFCFSLLVFWPLKSTLSFSGMGLIMVMLKNTSKQKAFHGYECAPDVHNGAQRAEKFKWVLEVKFPMTWTRRFPIASG